MTRIQRSDWLVRVTYSSIQVFKSRDWKPTVLTHSTADELVEIFAEVNWVEPLLYGTGNWTVLELCQILLHWLEELPEQTSTNKKTVLTPRDTNQPIRIRQSSAGDLGGWVDEYSEHWAYWAQEENHEINKRLEKSTVFIWWGWKEGKTCYLDL